MQSIVATNVHATDDNTKFVKDGETDIRNGPLAKRRCTDIIVLVLFVLHVFIFWIVAITSFAGGSPYKMIRQRDFMGNYCGTGSQWNNAMNMEKYDNLLYSMNVTTTFDPIAKSVLCSEAGRFILLSNSCGNFTYTTAQLDNFCGNSVSPSSSVGNAVSAFSSLVTNTVEQYTNPAKAAQLYLEDNQGTTIFQKATQFFLQVCASNCALTQNNSASRIYIYDPDPSDVFFNQAWKDMRSGFNSCGGSVIMDQFNFRAWDESDCPYEPAYCVPMPGAAFAEANDWGICYPKIANNLQSTITDTLANGLQGIAKLDITETVTRSFGEYVGDVLKTYDVAILTAFISLIIGFVCLILLRFFLGPAVWIIIILVFILLFAGGFTAIVHANQCANSSFVDAAKTQAANINTLAAGTNPFDVQCSGGWKIETEYARTLLKWCGYLLFVLATIFVVIVVCLFCRIRLAIAINKVAAQFIYHNPLVVLIPIVQAAIGILWTIFWVTCVGFVLSTVPNDYMPTGSFTSFDVAASGNDGSCTAGLNPGYAWKDPYGTSCVNAPHECWKCMPPRFIVGIQFWYSLFSFLWHNCFIIACGQCTVAGAVAIWFFTPRAEKWRTGAVWRATHTTFRYHIGSLAFGSLILAIIQLVKWFMTWLKKQSELEGNAIMAIICKILICCLWCFECIVKYMNKNAYIQIALLGKSFCTSTFAAFYLLLRNPVRFTVIFMLSFVVHFLAGVFIVTATTILGYFILSTMHPDVEPMLPTLCFFLMGYMSAQLFMGVYGMSVDATLHCFIATEEMDTQLGDADFVPKGLKNLVDEYAGKEDEGGCQGRLMCCRGCC